MLHSTGLRAIGLLALITISLSINNAAALCDMYKGGKVLGCLGTSVGGTNICAFDNSNTANISDSNNCCQQYQGGYSACVRPSLAGQYSTCYARVTTGACPKASLAVYTGGLDQYGRWTCADNSACADTTDGALRCVQHYPSQYGPGWRKCEV